MPEIIPFLITIENELISDIVARALSYRPGIRLEDGDMRTSFLQILSSQLSQEDMARQLHRWSSDGTSSATSS